MKCFAKHTERRTTETKREKKFNIGNAVGGVLVVVMCVCVFSHKHSFDVVVGFTSLVCSVQTASAQLYSIKKAYIQQKRSARTHTQAAALKPWYRHFASSYVMFVTQRRHSARSAFEQRIQQRIVSAVQMAFNHSFIQRLSPTTKKSGEYK